MSENLYQTPQSNVNRTNLGSAVLGSIKSVPISHGSSWIGESWRLFKSQPGVWIGMLLVYGILAIVANVIPIGNYAFGVIAPIFSGGWMIAAVNCDRDSSAKFDNLFAGFSTNAGTLAMVGVITVVLQLAIGVVVGLMFAAGTGASGIAQFFTMLNNPEQAATMMPTFMLMILVFLALLIPVMMLAWFAPVLVVQHNLGAWDAMQRSFIACMKNILPFTWYSILFVLLSFVAMIPLGLGLLAVLPMAIIAIYCAYKDIFLDA